MELEKLNQNNELTYRKVEIGMKVASENRYFDGNFELWEMEKWEMGEIN